MTDLDAILRAVLADPHDDTPRLVYAEICDDLAGVVACPACGGSGWTTREKAGGSYAAESPWLIPDFATVGCPRCGGARDRRGSGSVSNGMAERVEFIRVQCELARMPADEPFARVAEAVLAERLPRMSRLERNESRDILLPQCFPEARQRVADRDAKRKELRRRERELWGEYGREWFGDTALWLPTDEYRRASPHVPGFVVRRGFADEWRGPLSALVGGECGRCGGEARIGQHHDPSSDTMRGGRRCPDCVDGRTPGLDLAAVFSRHPIARVVLADREPTAASHQSGAWHWTWVGNDADSRVGLPRKLMAALSASGIARVFDSRDAAMDALSLACVNLGRAAAGLDPLT